LGSKLQTRLEKAGSMEYQQTWSQKVTPAGRPYWAHTASARRTSDKGCTGWPTTGAGDEKWRISTTKAAERRATSGHQISLECAAHLAGWPTPDTCAGGTGPSQKNRHAMRLQDAVLGWTTPNARDYKDSASPEALIRAMDSEKGSANLPRQVATIVGWCSPTVTDASRGVLPPRPHDTGVPLSQQVAGLTTKPSPAETGKPVASHLNPHFSRWLMGFPPEWCDCAVTATPSSRKSQRSLSAPTSKPFEP
jgi:hypothetical protein